MRTPPCNSNEPPHRNVIGVAGLIAATALVSVALGTRLARTRERDRRTQYWRVYSDVMQDLAGLGVDPEREG